MTLLEITPRQPDKVFKCRDLLNWDEQTEYWVEIKAWDAEDAAEKMAKWMDHDDYYGPACTDATVDIEVMDEDGKFTQWEVYANITYTYHALVKKEDKDECGTDNSQ